MTFKHQAPQVAAIPVGRVASTRVHNIFSDDWFWAKGFNLWEAHLQWLNTLGFTRALEQKILSESEMGGGPTGHEVVDALADFIFQTGYVNAHLGLTSSDVVDNVRLMQVQDSLSILREQLERVMESVDAKLAKGEETVGFTHWQAAAPVSWEHRVKGWIEPLKWLAVAPPCIFAKRFGGPVGDNASLKLILGHVTGGVGTGQTLLSDHPFDWHQFGLEHPNNAHPIQSSDHQCETAAVNWCCAVAAQLHKVALDLRFLASHGLVTIERRVGLAGSSSMPHKVNPFKWEKVCSICRSIASTQHEIWEVAAHNSLERTLDTSWQMKSLLERCFTGLALALDEMAAVNMRHGPRDHAFLAEQRNLISSDRDLTRRVLSGSSRWAAYQAALSAQTKQQ